MTDEMMNLRALVEKTWTRICCERRSVAERLIALRAHSRHTSVFQLSSTTPMYRLTGPRLS